MDFFQRISRELDLPPVEKEQAIKELRAHFQDIRDDLILKGVSVEDAEKEAAAKLGSPGSIAAGLGAVHMRDGWKSTLLALLPFLMAVPTAMMTLGRHARQVSVSDEGDMMTWYLVDLNRPLILTGAALLVVFAAAMLVVGVREILHNKRPTWLATFLTAATIWPVGLMMSPELPFALTMSRVRVGYAALDQSDSHPYGDYMILFIICYFLIVPLLMIACSQISKLKRFTPIAAIATIAVIGLLAITPNRERWLAFIQLGVAISALICPIAAVLVLFARHPHSTPSRGSLCIFTAYALGTMVLMPKEAILGNVPFAVTMISAAIAVCVYSRVADKKIKYAALLCGAAAIAAAIWICFRAREFNVITAIIAVLMLIPMLFEFRRGTARDGLIVN